MGRPPFFQALSATLSGLMAGVAVIPVIRNGEVTVEARESSASRSAPARTPMSAVSSGPSVDLLPGRNFEYPCQRSRLTPQPTTYMLGRRLGSVFALSGPSATPLRPRQFGRALTLGTSGIVPLEISGFGARDCRPLPSHPE
jgi:hypothetical protein